MGVHHLDLPVAIHLTLTTGQKRRDEMGLDTLGCGKLQDALTGMGDCFARHVLKVGLHHVMEQGNLGVLIPQVPLMQLT